MIAGTLIVMFSCTKENNDSVIKNETNDCPSCKAGIELVSKINKFKERLAYAKENVYRDGDEMTKEETIEIMEMLFNASYGFPAESYIQLKRDTVELTLPVNSQGYIQTTDEERRLEAEEMNSWYDKEYEFLFTVLPESLNKPENWIMTSIAIDAFEHFDNDYRWINHPNDVKYGLFYCVPDAEIDPPVDL